MRLPEENPPRRPGETAHYEDDPFELGKIDAGKLVVVEDRSCQDAIVTSYHAAMQRTVMPKTVSSTEAKARFGELLKWANESKDKVIVTRYGKSVAVLISYAEYEELEKLRQRELKRNALGALEALRNEVRLQNPDLTAEEAYRLAGFSEEVIQETLQADAELSAAKL